MKFKLLYEMEVDLPGVAMTDLDSADHVKEEVARTFSSDESCEAMRTKLNFFAYMRCVASVVPVLTTFDLDMIDFADDDKEAYRQLEEEAAEAHRRQVKMDNATYEKER